ncbi:MAG: PilZ domain-containing protein [Caenibius sp.]
MAEVQRKAAETGADIEGCARQPIMEERRGSPRLGLLIRAAKLVFESGEFLCVMRDVSESGVRIKVFHALPDDQPQYIEFATGDRIMVRAIWQDGDSVGLSFAEPQDVAAIVRERGPYRKRSLRFAIEAELQIRVGLATFPATVLNFSQFGARIRCSHHLARGQQIKITGGLVRDLGGTVAWRKDDNYGLTLDRTFPVPDTARLVARLQNPALVA